jgi:hypothetical protein
MMNILVIEDEKWMQFVQQKKKKKALISLFLAYNLIKSVLKRANNTSEVIDLGPKCNTKITNHLH